VQGDQEAFESLFRQFQGEVHRFPRLKKQDGDMRDLVALAFRRLPPPFQVVAVLALVEKLPYTEIADALSVPVGTVKSRIFRATRALREELSRPGIRP
jgi:DNA-directed RNA polymerase specialized sigma24 family protein